MPDISRVNLPAATTDVVISAASPLLRLLGVSVVETAGAVATLSIQEGTSNNTANELIAMSLLANESRFEWFPEFGIPCPGGLWLERITGTTRLVIYFTAFDYVEYSSGG